MSIINSQPLIGASGSTGYKLQRSVRLRSSASAYFNRTPASAGNRKTWTWSGWAKKAKIGSAMGFLSAGTNGNQIFFAGFSATDDKIYIHNGIQGTSTASWAVTSAVYRDPSAWYHIVLAVDTTQATDTNRIKLYVNNQLQTLSAHAGASTYPTQNYDTAFNNNVIQEICYGYDNSSKSYFDGYLTEINFIDGQALTPASFGEIDSTTGVWKPKAYSGSYGTNGFFLKFADNSGSTATTIGKDSSGNGNNWTPNNISVTAGVTYDSMLDVPTLTSATNANFPTWNPLVATGQAAPTDGNLSQINSTGCRKATMPFPQTGKWYMEWTAGSNTMCTVTSMLASNTAAATADSSSVAYYTNGNKYLGGTGTTYGSSFASGTVIGLALDFTVSPPTITFYNANTAQPTLNLTSGIDYVVAAGIGGTGLEVINFGQRPFTYTPPTGFKSLNTYNLPAPTIPNGATQFAATTYTGTNGVAGSVTGVGFQPDFVWGKRRGTGSHGLFDSVRGASAWLASDLTNAEATASGVTSFNANGFSYGTSSVLSEGSIVAWQWKASNAASVTNTSGSISSQVSANPSAGFSIVTYTGTGANATVGHGLGIAPKMMIFKNRTQAGSGWPIWHTSFSTASTTDYLLLNTTGAKGSLGAASFWNGVSTSTVLNLGTDSWVNQSAAPIVAYCFSEIAGYSKAFSYTGNGSTDGVFSYLGFRPRMILLKRTDTTGNWYIWDTSRNTYNVVGEELYPNLSNAAATATDLDLLSNGFKLRNSTAGFNASGGSYVGFAWAESPFSYSLAR